MNNFFGIFDSYSHVERIIISPLEKLIPVSSNLFIDAEPFAIDDECKIFILGNVYTYGEDLDPDTKMFGKWLLKIFREENFHALYSIDGEFTIICIKTKEVIIYREKSNASVPFFYSENYFGSQINYFKNIKSFNITTSSSRIADFLSHGYVAAPYTLFMEIKKLSGGNLLQYKNGHITIHELFNYNTYKDYKKEYLDEQTILSQFADICSKSIIHRTKKYKKVAALLSGGYDSGGIVHGLRKNYSEKFQTVSIGFKDHELSEVPYAQIMADHYKSDLSVYDKKGDEINLFPQVMKALDEPFHESGMMINFLALKTVAKLKPEILLGGDGNDQLYGTSSWYLSISWLIQKFKLRNLLKFVYNYIPKKLNTSNYLYFQIQFHLFNIIYPLSTSRFGFKENELKGLLKGHFTMKEFEKLPNLSFSEFYNYIGFRKDIILDTFQLIIYKASRMASYFNVPITFPYMSTQHFHFITSLPLSYKIKGTFKDIVKRKAVEKYLLKAYLKDKLPAEITKKKKQGGFVPLTIFLKNNKLNQVIKKIIISSPLINEYFDKPSVKKFLDEIEDFHLLPESSIWQKQAYGTRLFNLLSLVVWWQVNILDDKSNTLVEMSHKRISVD